MISISMIAAAAGPEHGIAFSGEVSGLQEECGVWGIWDPTNPALLHDSFIGLQSVQHRGEQAAGIASISATEPGMHHFRATGKVIEVFGVDGAGMCALPADSTAAIGHTRYTTDSSTGEGIQPRIGNWAAVAHNGQVTNKQDVAAKYEITDATSDSDVVARAINKVAGLYSGDVERATLQVAEDLRGSFSLTILARDRLIAIRDRHGVRPLQLGATGTGGFVVSSEVKAITDVPDAVWHSEVEPGEMVVISDNGVRRGQWADADPAVCVFEYAYLSNKTNIMGGLRVEDVRRKLGGILAEYVQADTDIIVPLPNSGIQAARGLAEVTDVPYVAAFTKNPEYGRSFIQSSDKERIAVAGGKLLLDATLVAGKNVVVVDDTLVRGHTARINNQKLRDAGAKRIDFFVAAPPYSRSCDLGVDTGNPAELIAARSEGDVERMRRELGVDRLVFLSVDDIRSVVGQKVCDFCIGGKKPGALPVINASQTPEVFVLANAPA